MKPFYCIRKDAFGETCEIQCEYCKTSDEGHRFEQALATEKRRKRVDYILTFFWLLLCLAMYEIFENKNYFVICVISTLLGIMKLSDYNNKV